MQEMVEYVERCPRAKVASNWKNFLKHFPGHLGSVKCPKAWRQMYTNEDISKALSYTRMIAYNEPVVSLLLKKKNQFFNANLLKNYDKSKCQKLKIKVFCQPNKMENCFCIPTNQNSLRPSPQTLFCLMCSSIG